MRGSHPTACSDYGPEGTPNPKAVGESEVNLVNKFRKSSVATERLLQKCALVLVKLLCYDFALS